METKNELLAFLIRNGVDQLTTKQTYKQDGREFLVEMIISELVEKEEEE